MDGVSCTALLASIRVPVCKMSKVLNVVLDVAESAIDYVQLGLLISVVYKYLLVIFGVSPRVVKS